MKVLTGGFCQQLLGEPFQHLFQVWLISERNSGFNMEKVGQGKRTSYKNYNSLECTPHVEYQTPFRSVTPLFLDQHFLDQSMGDRPI